MGFTFRKRNAKGFNISLSSRGLRISKTAKMGNATANVGHYFGGTHGGKTTGNVRVSASNGLQYRKDFTVGSSRKSSTYIAPYEPAGTPPSMSSWLVWLALHLHFYACLFYIPFFASTLFGVTYFAEGTVVWFIINALYGIAGWAPAAYLLYPGSGLYKTDHRTMPMSTFLWLSQALLFVLAPIMTLYYLAVALL